MATFDFAPMFRSTIGFDRLPTLFNDALERVDAGFPPYNIEKIGEDRYCIVMAVAGFAADDIEIVQKSNRVTVRGRAKEGSEATYLYRGIAGPSFIREFDLADHVEVTEASIDKGLLAISLRREVPAEMQPRSIKIDTSSSPSITDRSKDSVSP